MEIYIYIFFFLLFASLLDNRQYLLYLVICLFLVAVSGFRGNDVGVDTSTYRSIYNYLSYGGYWPSVEPGWNFLNKIVASSGANYLTFLTIVSVLTLAPIFYVSKKCSPYMYLSIFCFYALHFYSGAFNITRQYMAISWVLLAYYMYQQDKWKTALIILLFAFTFHYSCLFAVLAYFFVKNNLTITRLIIYMIVAFVFGTVVNEQIISTITFSEYANMSDTREDMVTAAALTIMADVYMLFIILSSSEILRNSFWGKLFALSIIVINATYMLHYGARVYAIFAITQIIYFPMFLKYSKFRNKLVPALMIIVYVSAQFWRMLLANANTIIPYELNYPDLKKSIFSFIL